MRSLYENGNNLFVRGFPDSWEEDELNKTFAKFGHIKSSKIAANQFGRHAYVCFDDPFGKDPLVGRVWAAKA